MALNRAVEGILDQVLNLAPREGSHFPLLERVALPAAGYELVVEVDLVVQERHDQAASRPSGAALLPLVAPDGVVRVHGARPVLGNAAENGVRVVGEEALRVEDCREALRAGLDGDGLPVAVLVHLANGVETVLEGFAVGSEPDNREDYPGIILGRRGAADLEDLGVGPAVDGISGGVSGVACNDHEVLAGDREGGAAVIRVASLLLGRNPYRVRDDVRVESMLPEVAVRCGGGIGEGVVGPVHHGVLTEHGCHGG